MQDYRKIDALTKDTERAGALARYLLSLREIDWTDWELDFLESLMTRARPLTKSEQSKLKKLEEKPSDSLTLEDTRTLAALRDVAARSQPLTMRQAEKLVELEQASQRTSTVDGFHVRTLVLRCAEAMDDLDEDEAEFVASLKMSGATALRSRQIRKLLAVSRRLGVIDDDTNGALDAA